MFISPALLFAILVLATYRLTRLVTDDRIFQTPTTRLQWWAESRHEARLLAEARKKIFSEADAHNPDISPEDLELLHQRADALVIAPHPDDEWRAPLAYLLSCPWCFSLYVATALTLLAGWAVGWDLGPGGYDPLWFALLPFALSATTGLLSYIEHTLSSINGLATLKKDKDTDDK